MAVADFVTSWLVAGSVFQLVADSVTSLAADSVTSLAVAGSGIPLAVVDSGYPLVAVAGSGTSLVVDFVTSSVVAGSATSLAVDLVTSLAVAVTFLAVVEASLDGYFADFQSYHVAC